jgi:alpha-aminoadipate carrier protein LysW
MVNCPRCDAVIDVEEEDLDEGDLLSCDECGASLSVTSKDPLEIEAAEDEDDEDEDDMDYDDEEEEEDEEDEDWK